MDCAEGVHGEILILGIDVGMIWCWLLRVWRFRILKIWRALLFFACEAGTDCEVCLFEIKAPSLILSSSDGVGRSLGFTCYESAHQHEHEHQHKIQPGVQL